MLQALNKKCSAGPHAGPVASEGHKAALWSMGLLRRSQDRCPFRSSGKLGVGPRGPLKGPIHSHSSQQHSSLVTASVPESLRDLPICGGVSIARANRRKKGELGVWDSTGLQILPSWSESDGVQGDFWCWPWRSN